MNYSFEKWDAIDLEKWVHSLDNINISVKNKIIAVIKKESYGGSDLLLCKTDKDIQDEFDLTPIQSKKFFKSIVIVLETEKEEEISSIALKAQQKKIEINEQQLDILINIFEGLFPSIDEKKTNPNKDESKENNSNPMKDFQEKIKNIGHTTAEFIKHLFCVKIKKSIKQKLVEICNNYFNLIRKTQVILRKYRATLNNLESVLSEIRVIFMYPVTIIEDLQYLDANTQKKVLNKLKNDTSDNLKKNLINYDLILKKIDQEIMPKVNELKDAWNNFATDITNVLQLVTTNIEEINEKISSDDKGIINTTLNTMKNISKIFVGWFLKFGVAPLVFAVGGLFSFTGGAVCGATSFGGPVGWLAGSAALALGSYVGYKTMNKSSEIYEKGKQLCNDGWRDLDVVIQEKITFLEKKKNLTQIEAMQGALCIMGTFGKEMTAALSTMMDNFANMQINNPHQQISFTNYMPINASIKSKIVKLGQSIFVSIEYLTKSKNQINDVEKVCAQQLSQYAEQIHAPLLQMLTIYQ